MDTTNNDAAFWIAGYTDYLRDVVGAADATRLRHLPTVRRFIATHSGQGAPDWTGLCVQRVTEFIRKEAAPRSGHGRAAPASATRSFLRFLAWRGVAPSGLDRAIPRIRRARHASLPTHLASEQLARLLQRPAAPGQRRIVTGRSSRCWPVWACAPARLPPSNLTTWIGMQGNSACAPGSVAASGCFRCLRMLAPRWPNISSTAARIIGTVGCSSPSPIQRGPFRLRRSPRSCGAIWCVLASRSGG